MKSDMAASVKHGEVTACANVTKVAQWIRIGLAVKRSRF
jgi:hypothetical protein